MNYTFLLCGLRVQFEVPWELRISPESRPFLVAPEVSVKPDLRVRFSFADSLSLPAGGIWNIDSYYVTNDQERRIWHCPIRGMPPFCSVVWNKNEPETVNIVVARGQENQIEFTKNLVDLLGLEMFLLHFGGLILHSSVVAWDGKGILFSAPSGTGKSTQAALWEQHMGSRTLNGDRAGIRFADGRWTAYGLPFAGTSGIYCNESVPIRVIVLLKQGPENVISRVTPMEAFRRLLPECSARRWDRGFMDQLIGVLTALIQSVPIYQLECRPDKEAVQLLRDTLTKED